MNARVGKSSAISYSLSYAQNHEKDGGILFANFTDLSASPDEQAQDWMATANNYKTQCYTIIISFTPEETAMLRSMPDNGRDKVRTIIRDFLDELSQRGNDVSGCPYIVARHDNTDNEHYHIVIRTTDINGKRFCDKFINKNANRAVACIAMKYGLETARKAAEREKAHQEAEGKRRKDSTARQRKPSASQSHIDEKMRRKRAVEEARKRKTKLKYLIEKAAKGATNFMGALAADGLTLFNDPKKGLCVRMSDSDGKERSYSLQKDLGIDMSITPPINITPPVTSKVSASKVTASPAMNKPSQSSPLKQKSQSPAVANIKDAPSGSSRNAEYEIRNGKGTDDPDEEWKRRNGYKM
ncbi:MAG: relaxase/mobilization nuclease domain-containing protein [Muribaculaceae bacterium]|nr:relaxase/mobilization nuclease domain-containing protein [Muribaculaceae bacterium]